MKKYLLLLVVLSLFVLPIFTTAAHAQVGNTGVGVGVGLGAAATLPQEGSWITDSEVTKTGKNAVRAGNLLDWTLKDYQWASSSAQQYSTSSLVSFWLTIQRIVYALFLFVVLVTAFMLIVTRGRSLSAKRFLPRFFLVVLLVTFSFSLVQFLYQIVDIFQGFFLKNPQGAIISSKDLLYIGFDYKNFQGIRVFGASFDESALMSLLLVKLTAFTYYVMAILLIFRKIILWFLIIISPVFPLLLLFYPLRNTAKIWVGEFFRWLLYAPLFAIFLSGLVKLWQSPVGLPLFFNFNGAGGSETYPTAVNILLGGPGQKVFLHNSVNLPDTFALYLVALLMLWVVIILPFILLQVFLDNLMAFNYKDNPVMKQMFTFMNSRAGLGPKSPIVPVGPPAPAGLARSIPFGRRFETPTTANLAKKIPTSANQQLSVPRSISQSVNNKTEVTNLTNLSIPTMRDIARFERAKLSKDTKIQQEISRTKQTLVQMANPASSSSSVERDRFRQIREKLVTQVRDGNQVASTVLNAATTYNTYSTQSSTSSTTNSLTNLIKNISQPAVIASKRESEKITQVKEQLTQAAAAGNQFAQTVLNSVNTFSTNQVTQIQQLLQNIAHPEKVTDTTKRQDYTSLREKIVEANKSGNPLANLLTTALEKSTSQEQVKSIQDQLYQAESRGDPLATEILRKTSNSSSQKDTASLQATLEAAAKGGDPLAVTLLQMLTSEKKAQQSVPLDAKTKLKTGAFPVVNRIQQVSLDDYEAVKKMWKENYKNLAVPDSVSGQQNRKQWVTGEVSDIQQTISLLSSANPADIEEGMKHVSDILPFLLIGGFSQTEIIAYLKAKMEAGKSILEDGEINEEEDMLLDAKRSADKALGHLAASVEAPLDVQESEGSLTEVNTSAFTPTKQIVTEKTEEPSLGTSSSNLNAILTTVKLPRITLQDIVRFETAQSVKEEQERDQIRSVLRKINSVNDLSNQQEKTQFKQLHEELISESKKGNVLASHILQASDTAGESSGELKSSEAVILLKTLQDIISPQDVSSASKDEYLKTNQTLLASRQKADLLAGSIIGTVDKLKETDLGQLSEFIQKVSNPTALTTASEQMHYSKLVERIAQASEDKNVTAAGILKTIRGKLTEESTLSLANLIKTEAQKGDQLAEYIAQSVLTSHSASSDKDITALYQQLLQEKKKGNVLASSILGLFAKQKRAESSGGISSTGLPKQNRLQQVSLEDYETVKKMWTESYASSQLNTSQAMTREQWIKQDMDNIAKSINLLSSTDSQQQEQGMEQVGEILPFLLLGGFSQTEVVGYLKAKLEAGRIVLQTLEQDNQEDVLVPARSVLDSASQAQSAQMESPQVQSSGVAQSSSIAGSSEHSQGSFGGESQQGESLLSPLGLQAPTLPEIVAYEAGKIAGKDLASNQQIGTTLKALMGSGLPVTSKQREQSLQIKETLETQAQAGNKTAAMLLSVSNDVLATPESVDDPNAFLMTLRKVLDPSLLADPAQQIAYRQARDLLMQERQSEGGIALTLMKLVDKVSGQETEAVTKLLERIGNPLTLVEDKQRELYASLKSRLEKEKETNSLAASIVQASSADITRVSANKIRVQLFEAAVQGNPLANQVLREYVTTPPTTLREVTTLYQQLKSSKPEDPFVKILLELLKDRTNKSQLDTNGVRLPEQNRLQQVSIDDYEAVKRMLLDMYLHADVPKSSDGKEQTREAWISSERKSTEQALSLLSSDVAENIEKGLELVKDVLPFLLLGGFSQNEVMEYLKAKVAAATQALQELGGGQEQVEVNVTSAPKINQNKMTAQEENIEEKE